MMAEITSVVYIIMLGREGEGGGGIRERFVDSCMAVGWFFIWDFSALRACVALRRTDEELYRKFAAALVIQ